MTPNDAVGAPSRRDHRDLVIEDLAADVVRLEAALRDAQRLLNATHDYTHWLQAALGRARDWTRVDVVHAWHDELDRREQARRKVAA